MSDSLARIRILEAIARRLEPDADARAAARDAIIGYTETFLASIDGAPAYRADKRAARGLRDAAIRDEPRDVGEIVELFRRCVDAPGLSPASPGHLGYIPGGGLWAAALGDYLADITNRFPTVRFAGPGAVEMEEMLLDWMAGIVGFPAGCGGNLASGGSVANLIAIVTAREAHGIRARDVERAVVYRTTQTHHCIGKALRIAGLGECVRRDVAIDDAGRMRADALAAAIASDRAAGLRPWLVVSSAGSTDLGAVDPIADIAALARAERLWHHVDAAYGGFFMLVPEWRPMFAGIADADSIVLDPHKGLFLPYGCGAVLVRDRDAMRRAHHEHAAYMQDIETEASIEPPSPADLSPELSRNFRGPRLWLPLLLHGVAPFRAALEEKLLLGRHFHRRIAEAGFEVGAPPALSVVTYRWIPETGDANVFNRALVEAVHRDGRVFISSTTVDGTVWLRLAAVAFRTHVDTIERAVDVLTECVARCADPAGAGAR